MSILTQLRKLEKDRTRIKEIGRTATKSYQELQPKYSQAVQAAKNYQSTLTEDYNQYVQSRNQAVDSYNQQLQQRYQAYQGAVQQGSGLERSYQTAQQELKRLEGVRNAAATEANRRYQVYSDNYQTVVGTGSNEYGRLLKSHRDNMNLSLYQANKAEPGSSRQGLKTREYEKFKKLYEDLQADTEYTKRFAEQQTATILRDYQDYVKNTYNPSVASYNQYGAQTYNPAAQAYQNFMGSGQVQSSLQSYQALAQDTGYADRASSQAKEVYDASAQRYQELQTGYQELEQPLSQYATEMKDASEQIQQLNLQIPGLQRSLKVEQDPRKRETRIGYGRSLMTSGTKRRSSVR